ncbi:MAG: NAD-dependent epimerase/dehydratase family protein [Kofleriaceae bacterium]
MSSGELAEAPPRTVVITGIAGRLGRLLTARLHRDPGFALVGLDRRPLPGRPKDVVHHQVDLRSKQARDVFRRGGATGRIDALVHMGVLHDPRATPAELYAWNIRGTAALLEHAAAYGVPKVVLLSSANVYGPRPENPQFLTEDAPMLAAQRFPDMRAIVELDHLVSTFLWRARETETVILRPVHILGSVHNAPSNYLRLDPLPTLLGFDPMLQPIHELDVVDAIVAALRPGVRGIYNVAGPGQVPLSEIARVLGRRTVPIPHPLATPILSLAFRLGLSGYPVPELDFIRYVCMVDGGRAVAELGLAPRHDLTETIRAVDSRARGAGAL